MQLQFVARQITGPVWIGDPCYVWPPDPWVLFCDRARQSEAAYQTPHGPKDGLYGRVHGYTFFTWRTAYGDGLYAVTRHGSIGTVGVDSGTLCIMPTALIQWLYDAQRHLEPPHWADGLCLNVTAIPEPDGAGNVQFGPYRIITTEPARDQDEEETQ